MRVVLQRVNKASVTVEGIITGSIEKGLLVFAGITENDSKEEIDWISDKIANLRIFEDENAKMNRSVLEVDGKVLLISQFTLYGDARKGRRPSFSAAAGPEKAKVIYEALGKKIEEKGLKVEYGVFGADMKVSLENDGPVTILLDSEKNF